MKTKIIPFFSLFLLLALVTAPAGTAHAKSAVQARSEQKIQLVAAPDFKAKGSAKFRNRSHEQELEVEVELSKRSAGTVLTVVVDDAVIGTITIDKSGEGRLSLNSDQGDTVPAIKAGSTIAIVTDAGDLILGGQF